MSNLEEVLDKNIFQLKENHKLLDEQNYKIKKISNNMTSIEEKTTLSKQILHRLNSLYYRLFNPIRKQVINNNLLPIRNEELDKMNENYKTFDAKLLQLKGLSYLMGEKIDEDNEILEENNNKLEKCLEDINNNKNLINKFL